MMKVKESAENYLETILVLSQTSDGVHAIDIAGELGFSKPSVSIAMKRLRENGYITIDEYQHINLTDRGRAVAERIYDRHRLLEALFTRLGVDAETANRDACKVEHDLSEETFACIRRFLTELEEQ